MERRWKVLIVNSVAVFMALSDVTMTRGNSKATGPKVASRRRR